MKYLLALLCLVSISFGSDLVTRKGEVFQNYRVTSIEGNGIRIAHRDGVAFIDYDELPSDLQAGYAWTEEKSKARKSDRAALVAAQQVAKEKAEQSVKEAQAKSLAQKARMDEALRKEGERQNKERDAETRASRIATSTQVLSPEDEAEKRRIAKENHHLPTDDPVTALNYSFAWLPSPLNELPSWWIVAAALALPWAFYSIGLLPMRIARGKSNYETVKLLNVIGLFTGIFWLIALIAALRDDIFVSGQKR